MVLCKTEWVLNPFGMFIVYLEFFLRRSSAKVPELVEGRRVGCSSLMCTAVYEGCFRLVLSMIFDTTDIV